VREIIGRVADKWTMLALEVLAERGRMRFTALGQAIGGVSQKMLTKTLRQMEATASWRARCSRSCPRASSTS
jgi:DNA-binding HxlR family transcriptional regulator